MAAPDDSSQPRGTGGPEQSRKVITAPYIGMLIILIILAGLGRYLQRNSRGGSVLITTPPPPDAEKNANEQESH